ncbi:MAG: nucleotidyltransferase domain-containing protein [Pseudomonadota bacterium]
MPTTFENIRAAKPQIERLAESYGFANIRVFGSVARGEDNEASDIDFLVDFIKPTFKNYFYFSEEVAKLLNRKVDIVDASTINNPIRREYIFRDAVAL